MARDLFVAIPKGLRPQLANIVGAECISEGENCDIISIPYCVGRWIVLEENTWHATGSATRRGRAALIQDLLQSTPKPASALEDVVSAGHLTEGHLVGALYGVASGILHSSKADFTYYRTHANHRIEGPAGEGRSNNIKKKIVETDPLWQEIGPEPTLRALGHQIPGLMNTWPCEMHALDQRDSLSSKFTAHTDVFMDARPVFRSCVIMVAEDIKLVVFGTRARGIRRLSIARP